MKKKLIEWKEKIVSFWKELWAEHKGLIIFLGLGMFIGALKAIFGGGNKNIDSDEFDDFEPDEDEVIKDIDESIFTDLAPEIENMVLNNSISKGGIFRSYDLKNKTHKTVEVTIDTIYDD